MPTDLLPTSTEPNLDSFVLRFVRSGEPASGRPASGGAGTQGAAVSPCDGQAMSWHGVIRHVQSNRERAFSRWSDAVAFISEFVDVRDHGTMHNGVQENQDEC